MKSVEANLKRARLLTGRDVDVPELSFWLFGTDWARRSNCHFYNIVFSLLYLEFLAILKSEFSYNLATQYLI